LNTNWSGWDNGAKLYDPGRPFHRIGSPSFVDPSLPASPLSPRATGQGYGCGCRNPDRDYKPDILEILTTILFTIGLSVIGVLGAGLLRWVREQLLRTLPGWVPVARERVPRAAWPSLVEREQELEGVLLRSFQTWTDVPVMQWHMWYDWNFHVHPADGYRYVRGGGNQEAHPGGDDENPVVPGPTMECEWDCGAIGDYGYPTQSATTDPGQRMASAAGSARLASLGEPGPMFAPGSDWAWPMTSQYVWFTGRWIYDCGHAHHDLMNTEIHPCKAIASARWEAAKFDEHPHRVPAIQFMFFACRRGGYISFPRLNDKDYEFIVDLPQAPVEAAEYAVGHTPAFPLNTLMLRPRLLMKADYSHFGNAFGRRARAGEADPQVELLPPAAAGEAPKQVKVRIPLTRLPANVDSYGVVLSLGWHDPRSEQRDKVKRVEVSFLRIERFETHEAGDAEWQVKFGVNGRWRARSFGDLREETRSLRLGETVTLHLALDDLISINCHGMEEDLVGDVMKESNNDRTLKGDGRPYTWRGDIDQPDNDHASGMAEAMLRKLAKTFEDQNVPLGFVDPGYPGHDAADAPPNPLTVRRLMEISGGPGRTVRGRQTAYFTTVRSSDEKLVYDRNRRDYVLHYTIEYHDQPR
jgi:hypothetical protein